MSKGKTLAGLEFSHFMRERCTHGETRSDGERARRLRPGHAVTMAMSLFPCLRASRSVLLALAVLLASCTVVGAQTPPVTGAQTPDTAAPIPAAADVELNVINLPTTKSMPRHGSYFRLTHRFARDLRRGDFGQLAEDLFALDNGAIIGLDTASGSPAICRPAYIARSSAGRSRCSDATIAGGRPSSCRCRSR